MDLYYTSSLRPHALRTCYEQGDHPSSTGEYRGHGEGVSAGGGLDGYQLPGGSAVGYPDAEAGGGGTDVDDVLSELGSALDELESNLADNTDAAAGGEGGDMMPFDLSDEAEASARMSGEAATLDGTAARSPEEEAREYQLRLQAEAEALLSEGRGEASKVPESFRNMGNVDGGDGMAASYRSRSEAAAHEIRVGLSLGGGGGGGDVSADTEQLGQTSTADPNGMVPLVPAPAPRQTTESLLAMLDNFHDAWDPYEPTGIPMFWREFVHEVLLDFFHILYTN